MHPSHARRLEILRNERDHVTAEVMARVRKIAAQLRNEDCSLLKSARSLEECLLLYDKAHISYNAALMSSVRSDSPVKKSGKDGENLLTSQGQQTQWPP